MTIDLRAGTILPRRYQVLPEGTSPGQVLPIVLESHLGGVALASGNLVALGSVGDWGAFPTALNASWDDWHLDEAPLTGSATYVQPPALPSLPNIPGNAVAATPANLNTLVASNPSGTNFDLADGTYNLTVATKGGNKYFGNPSNPLAVVISGGSYNRNLAFSSGSTNVGIYYLTWERFIGGADSQSRGAVETDNAWDVRRCVSRWNKYAGIRGLGSNGSLMWHTSYQNGQYGVAGPFSGWTIDCAEIWGNSTNVGSLGVPDYAGSDAGACKIGQMSSPVTTRRVHSHSHADRGWWFDIRVEDVIIEYCWIEDNERDGIIIEAGQGPVTIRFNRLINNGTKTINASWWNNWFAATPMNVGIRVTRFVDVYGNVSRGFRGIGGYNWAHPQLIGTASTPGSDTPHSSGIGSLNAAPVRDLDVHHNYIYAHGGGSNPGSVAAGITSLAHTNSDVGDPYTGAFNNSFHDNIYEGTHVYNWSRSGPTSAAQWAAAGHD